MTDDEFEASADLLGLRLKGLAGVALDRLMRALADGVAPRDALDAVQAEFGAGVRAEVGAALAAATGTAAKVAAVTVSGVSLSRRLYDHGRDVQAASLKVIRDHVAGVHDARALGLALFEGYGFKVRRGEPAGDPLKVTAPLPLYLRAALGDAAAIEEMRRSPYFTKQLRDLFGDVAIGPAIARVFGRARVTRLRSPALRAAYTQALDAVEQGAGRRRLANRLRVAFEERNRYLADRIAQTELARVHIDTRAAELRADTELEFVQVRMSQSHPRVDICDFHSALDKFGLGRGVYPKALAPKPPFHPFCRCRLAPRIDLTGQQAREREGAEVAFLREQGAADGARIMGSRDKLGAVLRGVSVPDVLNADRDPLYRLQYVGADKVRKTRAKRAAPVVPGSTIPAFVPQKTVAAAARFAEQIVRAPGGKAWQTDGAGVEVTRFRHQGAKYPADVRDKKLWKASYTGLDLETANAVNEWLVIAQAECDRLGIPRLRGVNTASGAKAEASMGDGVLAVNKKFKAKELDGPFANIDMDRRRASAARYNAWKAADGIEADGKARPFVASGYFVTNRERALSTLWHEFGHHVHQQLGVTDARSYQLPPLEAVLSAVVRNVPAFPSQYSRTNSREFFAECFSAWKLGRSDLVPQFMLHILETVDTGKFP